MAVAYGAKTYATLNDTRASVKCIETRVAYGVWSAFGRRDAPGCPHLLPEDLPDGLQTLSRPERARARCGLEKPRGRPPKSPPRSWGQPGTPTLKNMWSTMAGMASTKAPREHVPRVGTPLYLNPGAYQLHSRETRPCLLTSPRHAGFAGQQHLSE